MNKKINNVDVIIVGAGIFGLYAAKILTDKGKRVAIIEKSLEPFMRASSINQARVHNGYHYPRSYETAKKVSDYFQRFNKDFSFAINNSFKHVYAISAENSKTSSKEFIDFCEYVNIPCEKIQSNKYFKPGTVEEAFLVEEPAFDFKKIKDFLLTEISDDTLFFYGSTITDAQEQGTDYVVKINNESLLKAPLVINASYSGINDVLKIFNKNTLFDLKYELCEMIFCSVADPLKNTGFTVMDGEYFSIMPFGDGSLHSLTSVCHTPHKVSYNSVPDFQENHNNNFFCEMHKIKNCSICSQQITTAWKAMNTLSQKYLNPEFSFDYQYSKFEIKPILKTSEQDDSRPTIIKIHNESPKLMSVFSGKVSTIYDLENYL